MKEHIEGNRQCLLSDGVILFHNNALLCFALQTMNCLQNFGLEVVRLIQKSEID
jgi:hypothetical protein